MLSKWWFGEPELRREFLHSEDLADACVYLMNLPDDSFGALLGSDETMSGKFEPPLINIGTGEDLTVKELAQLVATTVDYGGAIAFDSSKPDGRRVNFSMFLVFLRRAGRPSISLSEGLALAYGEILLVIE